MRALFPFLLVSLSLGTACNDYDLYRDNDAKPVDTGTPVHEEEPDEAPDIRVYCAANEDCEKLDFGFVMQDCPSNWLQVTIENAEKDDLEDYAI